MRYYTGVHRKHRWIWDIVAVVVVLGYAWTVRYTTRGAADPVWTEIQRRGVLRVGTDPGFRPFAEQREGRLQGYDIDLVNELGRRLGLEVEFVPVGYDALYDALSTGRVDLLAAALPLAPEQGWRARFTTPYLNAGQLLIVGTGANIQDESQLGGRRVGVALGSEADTLARKLHRDLPSMTLQSTYETAEQALDALAGGELDAVITDTVSALTGVSEHPSLVIARPLTFEPYVLAVPIAAYQLHQATNRQLDEMQQDKVFEQLNARWFRHDSSMVEPIQPITAALVLLDDPSHGGRE